MARVRVDGRWLHSLSVVGGLKWSHRIDGGCAEASWTMLGLAPGFAATMLRRGSLVEVFDGLVCCWRGVLAESGEGSERECVATGLFGEAARFMCFAADGVTPTSNVDIGISRAITDGWGVEYATGSAPTGVASTDPQKLDEAVLAAALASSQRASVRADGVLRFEADPTTPQLMVSPGIGTLARADEEYVTHVVVYYVKSVSGTPPVADDWGTVTASDDAAATIHGRSTHFVDITERGVIADEEAARVANGVLARTGARLSFANNLTVSADDLRHVGGARVSLAHVRAGQMVRVMGARSVDGSSSALDIVVGGTDYVDGAGEITLSPVGLAPRNLADIIASIPTQGPSRIIDRSA